jgi:hypothetical protein
MISAWRIMPAMRRKEETVTQRTGKSKRIAHILVNGRVKYKSGHGNKAREQEAPTS